jgi:hypothetical protein
VGHLLSRWCVIRRTADNKYGLALRERTIDLCNRRPCTECRTSAGRVSQRIQQILTTIEPNHDAARNLRKSARCAPAELILVPLRHRPISRQRRVVGRAQCCHRIRRIPDSFCNTEIRKRRSVFMTELSAGMVEERFGCVRPDEPDRLAGSAGASPTEADIRAGYFCCSFHL